MMKRLAILCLIATSCTTGQLSDLDYSLADIQKGVYSVAPKGIAKVSSNRRTYSSKYFDPESIDTDRTTDKESSMSRQRAYMVATILGDRRPYSIELEVVVEEDESDTEPKKDDDFIEGKFVKVGSDKGLAKHLREKLANYLARLERNKNLIDDFRPF